VNPGYAEVEARPREAVPRRLVETSDTIPWTPGPRMPPVAPPGPSQAAAVRAAASGEPEDRP
jgi:hypothetical protein